MVNSRHNAGWVLAAALTLSFTLTPAVGFEQLKVRGTVRDRASHKPIRGATVTASGDQAKEDEITDDEGFFRLVLEGVAGGSLVRIRVQKEGYLAYDRQVAVSEEIPIEILISPAPRAHPSPANPAEAHFLEQLKSSDARIRASAIDSLKDNPPVTGAASAAIAAAILDGNAQVRMHAMWAVQKLQITSKTALANLTVTLQESSEDGRLSHQAAYALGTLGPAARSTIPALLAALKSGPRFTAAIALVQIGAQDPRIDNALVELVGDDTGEALEAMPLLLKMGPAAARMTPQLIGELRAQISETPGELRTRHQLIQVLESIGPSGEAALKSLMASLEPAKQAELALAWVEVKPAAKPDILASVQVEPVQEAWAKMLASDQRGVLEIPGGTLHLGPIMGDATRAAVGILVLGLEPQEEALTAMRKALSAGDEKIDYAAFYVSEMDPSMARSLLPALLSAFKWCAEECREPATLQNVGAAILKSGDQTSIGFLEEMTHDSKCDEAQKVARQTLDALTARH